MTPIHRTPSTQPISDCRELGTTQPRASTYSQPTPRRLDEKSQPVGKLLGFDAREMWQEFLVSWSQERKEPYLLRSDIKKPLSTDTMVWRSVFEEVQELEPPVWRGALDLWDDLGKMADFLKARRVTSHISFWIVGVTLVSGEFGEQQEAMGYPTLPALDLPAGSEGWTLLGYDVSDHSLLSGLTNCGYTDEEKPELQKQWGLCLNRYHLFDDVQIAVEFKEITDQRVPEHAPFFVYGLYLIRKGLRADNDSKSGNATHSNHEATNESR
jgi:hypothetical protein